MATARRSPLSLKPLRRRDTPWAATSYSHWMRRRRAFLPKDATSLRGRTKSSGARRWQHMTATLGSSTQIVGDDLLVTNVKFLERGIKEKAANAILIKVNQIGTLTETIAAVDMAHAAGWRAIISHR